MMRSTPNAGGGFRRQKNAIEKYLPHFPERNIGSPAATRKTMKVVNSDADLLSRHAAQMAHASTTPPNPTHSVASVDCPRSSGSSGRKNEARLMLSRFKRRGTSR